MLSLPVSRSLAVALSNLWRRIRKRGKCDKFCSPAAIKHATCSLSDFCCCLFCVATNMRKRVASEKKKQQKQKKRQQ